MSYNLNDTSNISKNKLQEINDLQMLIKKEKMKHMRNKIFTDLILEAIVPTSGINELLRVKIKDIILRGDLINVFQNHAQISNIILDNFRDLEITFEEQKELKVALEHKIQEKDEEFLKEINKLCDINVLNLEELLKNIKFDCSVEKNEVISLQKKLVDQQNVYINNLILNGEKLQELIDLKTKITTEVAEKKSVETEFEMEKLKLRFKMLHQKSRLEIFQELPMSIDAYRKALNNLREQQIECNKEIDQIKIEIDKYKLVSKNQGYFDILQEYKQYKQGIENRLWVQNKLSKDKQ